MDLFFSKQKDYLLRIDYIIYIYLKYNAVRDIIAKSRLFAKQYSKAETKTILRKKYTILRRSSNSGYNSDLKVFKR